MPEIVLLAHPDGRFTALYDGRPLVTSRCPFFDAARRLLELGFRPDELLEARHHGSTTVAMRCPLGDAAQWTIYEGARGFGRVRWRPFPQEVSGKSRRRRAPARGARG